MLGVISLLALNPQPSLSQDADRQTSTDSDSTVWLPEIVIAETRIPASSRESTARVTNVATDQISAFAYDLGSVLRAGGGFHIRDYGPAGLSTLNIRGGSASHVGIVYDGISLQNAQLGEFDLSLFGMDGTAVVQVVHGSGSSWLGGQAASGLIVVEPDLTARSGTSIEASTGSFGQRSAAVRSIVSKGAIDASVAYRFHKTDGDFQYVDETLFPVQEVRRKNASRDSHEILAIASLPGLLPRVGFSLVNSARDLPGSVGTVSIGEEQYDTNMRVWASETLTRGRLLSKTNLSYQSYRLRYLNPGQGVDDTGHAITLNLEQSASWTLERLQIVAGAMITRTGATHPSLPDSPAENSGAVYTSVELHNDRVHWTGSVRYDRTGQSNAESIVVFNPRTGINVRLIPSGNIRLKASAGRSSTVPTFNDRFWSGVGASGNPELKPERGWDGDLGLFAGDRTWTIEVTGFLSRMRDRIEWAPDERSIWSPSNIGVVLSRGIESSVSAHNSFKGLDVRTQVFYTITRSVDRTDLAATTYDKQLRFIPVQSGTYSVKVASGSNILSLRGELASQRFITSDEQTSLAPYATFDAEYQRSISLWKQDVSARLAARNITNNRYSLVAGYPMPGRHYYLGLSINL